MSLSAAEILSDTGPLAAVIGARGFSFESRPQQIAMARAVEKAFDAKSHLVAEAGTGTGKSFAYLAPAIRRIVEHGETVVVATNTIALQEQLLTKDIPLLTEAVGGGAVRPVLVKGRGNYLSIRRLKLASERQEKLLADEPSRRSLHVIEDWAYETDDGTLSTLPPLDRPGVWDRVRSDTGNCMGRKCTTYDRCFYQNARRDMEQANLLVCNHALFFSDLALRGEGVGFLPRYDQVVLDEAHAVEDVAAEHFGISLTEGRVGHLLGQLFHSRTRKGFLGQLRTVEGEGDQVDKAIGLTLEADECRRDFFDGLLRYGQRLGHRGGRVREAEAVANPLSPAMTDLALRLRRLKDVAKTEPDRFELNSYAQRAAAIADEADALITQASPGYAYWIDSDRGSDHRGSPRVTLACAPIEVGPILTERLFDQDFGVVLTSATLATRTAGDDEPAEHAETAFAHAIARLGCAGADTLQLGSPFDYARQVELHIDRTMPAPKGRDPKSEQHHQTELASRILDHVVATEGGAFVLFTSFKQLYALADRLRGPLDELGYPLLAQNRDGSRTEILERFRADPASVLFGAASFWQGVDVRGDGLRNVIITRLPFEPPDRPLTEARLERIQEQGGDPFRDDSLPRAVLRFKQGFGRLIRSSEDRGRVVVLDPRIVTTRYGRAFLRALPEGLEAFSM